MRRMVGWVKREEREPVYLAGSVRLRDGKRHSVTITDLSPDGCRVESRQMLAIGETVELDVAGRETLRASVRWSVLGAAGLQYV